MALWRNIKKHTQILFSKAEEDTKSEVWHLHADSKDIRALLLQ